MSKNRITFFAVDNGDASLIEAHGKTVMTDIKYRAGCADEEDDDLNDFAPTIRRACNFDRLDIFVLTHPDEDHLLGFSEVFHLGVPTDRDPDPDDGEVKLIIDELWCSPYAADPNYTTSVSKPVLDEIARRKRLVGSVEGEMPGNRLRVLTATDGTLETLTSGLDWRLLAPTEAEANIPKAKEGDAPNSSNRSSLVIQWVVTVGGRTSKLILGGDSDVDVWERLNREYSDEALEWHILLAPHHCSRRSMGREVFRDGERDFEWSQEAISGLDHPQGSSPHVVSSSSKFNASTPPNPLARDRYHKILAKGGDVNDGVRARFLVTAGKVGEEAEDIVFRFTSSGPTRSLAAAAVASAISTPASSGGGSYGST